MNSKPLISLGIAHYNNEDFFVDCYNSIIKQTYTNWEVIIIDDSSTNSGALDKIKKIIGEDTRFKLYINEMNSGVGYTKNRCVKVSKGEIFGFIDPDDALTSEALEKMVQAHLENPEVGLIYSNMWFCDDKLNPQKEKKGKQVEHNNKMFFNLGAEISHFASFKRKLFDKTTGISSYFRLAEDQDLYTKMYDVAPVKYIDETLLYYRIHGQGISTNEKAEQSFQWFWIVIHNRAQERGVVVNDLFSEYFARIWHPESYKKEQKFLHRFRKNIFVKVLNKIGLLDI